MLAVALLLGAGNAAADEGSKLTIGGTTYTKWLYSNIGQEGSMYNFTTVPGESSGHNGQGTELELLLDAKLSREVEVKGRIHSRFSQNFWTNFGGFGGSYDPAKGPDQCTGGSCGEYDPRSNQYVKLRGMTVVLTPGYSWVDSATIGANDLAQFDPLVLGKIRYIDRDNASAVLLQGSAMKRAVTWDAIRVSLPRLWAGPNFGTGSWTSTDAAYALQARVAPSRTYDVTGLFNWVDDSELNPADNNPDNGTSHRQRYNNAVGALKVGAHLGPWADLNVKGYYSWSKSYDAFAPAGFFVNGYSPVPAGEVKDFTFIADWVMNDPFGLGLNINVQAFSVGAKYASIMAARREADVLLTEGHDGTWAFPGPSNAKYGVFGGAANNTVIGYGGWSGNAQQVATVNVDNEFTDFDEPMAETVIGWKGVTINPVWSQGPLELAGEASFIGYNTNWQAWGDASKSITDTIYPAADGAVGVGSFRAAYAPFQDKATQILVLRARYALDVPGGLDLFGKVKYIHETDKRMNDANFLPYEADGTTVHNYSPGNSTSALYGNPGTPGQFKPFDSLADDDRKMNYLAFTGGVGRQVTDQLYLSLSYVKYLVDLKDGNTAFQAYNLQEVASGKHDKNQIIMKGKYNLAGIEFGGEGQYSFGTFKPDFGGGYTPQAASASQAADTGVAVGTLGFQNRFGGWNTLETRKFEEYRLKVFMKAQF